MKAQPEVGDRIRKPLSSSESGELDRLTAQWPSIVPVHTPVHASWLNQVEIYFSMIQRKVLTPNDFESTAAVNDRLFQFQAYYQEAATPFQWKFTRRDLNRLLKRIDAVESRTAVAA